MDRIQGYGNNTGISNEYWDTDNIQGYGHRIQGYGQNKLDRIEGMWMNTGIWIAYTPTQSLHTPYYT